MTSVSKILSFFRCIKYTPQSNVCRFLKDELMVKRVARIRCTIFTYRELIAQLKSDFIIDGRDVFNELLIIKNDDEKNTNESKLPVLFVKIV